MPLTDINSTMRIHVIMETRVPICGEYPFLGPTIFTSASAENAGCDRSPKAEAPVVNAAAVFRKLRLPGAQSRGNMGPPFRAEVGHAMQRTGECYHGIETFGTQAAVGFSPTPTSAGWLAAAGVSKGQP